MPIPSAESIKRPLTDTIDFTPLYTRHSVCLPTSDVDTLQDILLQFYAHPTTQPVSSSHILVGLEGLRVLLDDRDLTEAVRITLQKNLQAMPAEQLVAEYRASTNEWLAHLAEAGLDGPELTRDIRAAASMSRSDIIAMMAKMGDRSRGWSGALHPLNYIFRGISLPAISLRDLIFASDANGEDDSEQLLSTLQPRRLIFACERPKERAASWMPYGKLVFTIESVYSNPLVDLIQQAIDKAIDARRAIEDERVNYLAPIKDEIEQSHTDMIKGFSTLQAALSTIETAVGKV
jgi:hypothetical protein